MTPDRNLRIADMQIMTKRFLLRATSWRTMLLHFLPIMLIHGR